MLESFTGNFESDQRENTEATEGPDVRAHMERYCVAQGRLQLDRLRRDYTIGTGSLGAKAALASLAKLEHMQDIC